MITLESLAGGAASERFGLELQKVLNNIADRNTTNGKRSVKLEVTIKPNRERDQAEIEISCTSKLAPVCPYPSRLFIVTGRDGVRAIEKDPAQTNMFETDVKVEGHANSERKVD